MKRIALYALFGLLFAGCEKPRNNAPNTGMPARTETGANIIACKVNGKVRVYDNKHSHTNLDGVEFLRSPDSNKYVYIWGEDKVFADDISMTVYTWDIELNKEYQLATGTRQHCGQYFTGEGNSNEIYKTWADAGYIKFTRYDSLVVAGIFSFDAYTPDSTKLEIREGFFDISVK